MTHQRSEREKRLEDALSWAVSYLRTTSGYDLPFAAPVVTEKLSQVLESDDEVHLPEVSTRRADRG